MDKRIPEIEAKLRVIDAAHQGVVEARCDWIAAMPHGPEDTTAERYLAALNRFEKVLNDKF